MNYFLNGRICIKRFTVTALSNKGERAKNQDRVGHVMKETNDKIVVFGDSNYMFDISKSKIIAVEGNFLLASFLLLILYYIIATMTITTKVKVLSASKEEFMGFVLGSIPSQKPMNYDKIIGINKSMVACDKVEITDLEAGPNSCGIKT
jgi:hypothetical protein